MFRKDSIEEMILRATPDELDYILRKCSISLALHLKAFANACKKIPFLKGSAKSKAMSKATRSQGNIANSVNTFKYSNITPDRKASFLKQFKIAQMGGNTNDAYMGRGVLTEMLSDVWKGV